MNLNKIKIKNMPQERGFRFLSYPILNVWKKFLNVSLRVKLIGLAIFTTIFLGFIIIYFMFSFYNGEISHDAKFMSSVTGRYIAEDAANFILNRNTNRLNKFLRNKIKNNKSILYILVENNKGIIVASAFQKGFYLNIVNNLTAVNNNRNHLSTIKLASAVYGEILDTSVPMFNGKFGIVKVGVSLKHMKDSFFVHEAPLFYKYISLVLIFTAILLYLIFEIIAWRFLTPVVKLWEAAGKIKKGDYDVHIHTFSDDEIGKLSKAFNEMALSLKDAELERMKNEDLRKNFISGVINAQEEERKSISRSLHDRLGQFFSSVKIKLRMLDDVHTMDEMKSKIHQIRDDLTVGLSIIHDIAKNLRPSILDEMGLVNAINIYVADAVKNNNIKIDFYPINIENHRLNKHIAVNIYRIVQEAVLNVIRHACASSIKIILEMNSGNIRGIIEDNGSGFGCCGADGGDYLGINSMKERAKLLGGELAIESEKDLGTVVKFNIPLADDLENNEK